MADTVKASTAGLAAGIVLSVLACLLWVMSLAAASDLGGSDAAGNALAQAYTAFGLIALWLLLAILLFIAWLNGAMPWPAAVAAVILLPLSGFAVLDAVDLLARPDEPPYLWPLVVPALAPPLMIASAIWALLPQWRPALPAPIVAPAVWGGVLIVSLAIIPLQQQRARVIEAAIAAQQKYDADLAKVAPDAPLWEWTPFLNTRNEVKKDEVIERMRKLDRRQADAELMLARDDFPLGLLGRIDLMPTPSLCDKARAELRQRAEALVLKNPGSKPYVDIAMTVGNALAAMRWLVGYGCACNDESIAWESMAKGYRDTGYDIIELRELRDPKELGRALREAPERFSMLTPQAHLKAWLKFTDDKATRDEALAGARKLDHRTGDAVEMLKSDEYSAWTVLAYLPALDLQATPALCTAAQNVLRARFANIYRPTADDPRSYHELLDRIGGADLIGDVVWLASHGCEAEALLDDTEALIRTYQDSPARADMLARLSALHHKT